MAEETETPAPAEEKKGGKKKLIIIVLLVVILGGAGYWFFLKPSGGETATLCPPATIPGWKPTTAKGVEAAAKAAAAASVTLPGGKPPDCPAPEQPKEGGVVKIDPFTVSLADGGYLKVGLALELSALAGETKLFQAEGRGLKAANIAIEVLGARTAAQLAPGEPRHKAQEEITAKTRVAFANEEGTQSEVIDVLFTEFVMQ
jgi:flagellar FliL protein